LTPTEYLDPARFPLTTRAGITPLAQVVGDAIDRDKLRALAAHGVALTDGQRARLTELERKAAVRPAVLDQLLNVAQGN
jgi:hypothetical protein